MAGEKWIWLGEPGLLDGGGALQFGSLGADEYAFPFLERKANEAEKVGLRVLIRKDAAAALAWLNLLGTTKDLTSNSDWAVLTMFNGATWKAAFTPAATEVDSENFNPPTSINFDTGPVIQLGVLTLKVKDLTVSLTDKSVTMTLEITPSKFFTQNSGVTPPPLTVTMLYKAGKLQIQDAEIPSGPLTAALTPFGTGDNQVILRAGDGRVGAQLNIAGGSISPAVLPIGRVVFRWTKLSVFISIVSSPGSIDLAVDLLVPDAGTEVCAIDFSLPLIEAQAPADRSDSNARLLVTKPVSGTNDDSLVTFGFTVAVEPRKTQPSAESIGSGTKLNVVPPVVLM